MSEQKPLFGGGPLFGQPNKPSSAQPAASNSSTPFSFGNSTGNTSSPFGSFGQQSGDANKTTSTPAFSLSTPNKSTSTPSENLSTPTNNASGLGQSTTPAGPPPSSNLFGASSTGSSSLFSTTNTATSGAPSSGGGLFGGASASKPSLFGGATTPFGSGSGGALFGAKSDDKAKEQIATSTPSNMFGGFKPSPSTANTSENAQKPALFGAAAPTSSAQSTPNTSAPGSTANLFAGAVAGGQPGEAPKLNNNLFKGFGGQNATQSSPTAPTGSQASAAPSSGITASSAQATSAPSLFGTPATAKTPAPSTSTPNPFGAPAGAPSASPAPTSSNLFGAPSNTQSGNKTGGLFSNLGSNNGPAGSPATPLGAQPATSKAASETAQQPSTLFQLGSTPASAATSQSQAASAPGALFGNPTSGAAPSETTASSSKPSLFGAAAAASSSTSNAQTNTTTSDGSTAPVSAPAGSLFGSAPANSASTNQQTPTGAPTADAKLSASTSGPPPDAQSRLKNKSMDEIITKWATDLQKYQKEFQSQSEKVASWDRLLVENSNAITKLYRRTFQAERDTGEVQKQLTAVENQQNELEQWLTHYEGEVDDLMSKEGLGPREGLTGPDQERERTYKSAERVSEKLSEMGHELTGLIEEINSVSATLSSNSKPDDPLSQIVRVLNTHLSQLQTIDQDTATLQEKVAIAQKESRRMGSSTNGLHSAADDFYRSYRGRS